MTPVSRMRYAMGTLLEITVHGERDAAQSAVSAALDEVQQWERWLSRFREDSVIARLNRNENPAVPEPVAEALRHAEHLRDKTGGAFDPCIGGAWDLGGFGKGWALDRARERIMATPGTTACRFDFGGQLLFWNRDKPLHETITIAAESENSVQFEIHGNVSVSTSGPGERGHHIQNPHTRLPVQARSSVTVVAPTAAEADGWSTALQVMGPQRGSDRLGDRPAIRAVWRKVPGDCVIRGNAVIPAGRRPGSNQCNRFNVTISLDARLRSAGMTTYGTVSCPPFSVLQRSAAANMAKFRLCGWLPAGPPFHNPYAKPWQR